MTHEFEFNQGCSNVEVLRINVDDPLNGKSNINPGTLDKVELEVANIVISSSTGEITFDGDVMQIEPTLEQLALLTGKFRSELLIYKEGKRICISKGNTKIYPRSN